MTITPVAYRFAAAVIVRNEIIEVINRISASANPGDR